MFTNIYNCIHYYIYSRLSSGWWRFSVAAIGGEVLGGEVLGGGCLVILGGWCRWRGPRWLPSVERSSVAGAVASSWCRWCPRGGCHPGALPGIPASILHPGTTGGYARHSSARRAVSRLNQSCGVRLIDAITLIINYLSAPFGCAFT